jgi:voltage-gated potassium channel Kch
MRIEALLLKEKAELQANRVSALTPATPRVHTARHANRSREYRPRGLAHDRANLTMHAALEFLNNASVGAFIGAAAAFLLVILTDWRRNRRVATVVLPSLLKKMAYLARSRHEDLVAQSKNPPRPVIALPFAVDRLERLTELVADRLDDLQARALEAVMFFMSAADRVNEGTRLLFEQIDLANTDMTRGETNRRSQGPALLMLAAARYNEEQQLLKRIYEIIDNYVANRLTESFRPPP